MRIEYYENAALAEMRFSYTLLSGQPGTGGQFPGTATVTAYRLNVRNGPGVNFASVSYTHLDVYKRQSLREKRGSAGTNVRRSLRL